MSNLRLLIISQDFFKVMNNLNALNHPNDQRHLALPNNLRYLSWSYCPFKCLAFNHKQMALVQLDLLYSKFEYLWEGVMVILFFLIVFLLFIILFFFFKCSYKCKYTPGVFELSSFHL